MAQDYISRKICTTGPALVEYLLSKSDEDNQKRERFKDQKEFYFAILMMYQSLEKLLKAVYVHKGNHKAPLLNSLEKGIQLSENSLDENELKLINKLDDFNRNKNNSGIKEQIGESYYIDLIDSYKEFRLKLIETIN